MIVDIKYKNIRVFREEAVFSMEASDAREKDDNVVAIDCGGEKLRLLKVGALYGPNASGKTTTMYAVYALRDWLLNVTSAYFNYVFAPFMLDDFSAGEPSQLTVRFLTLGMMMRYSVGFLNGKCCLESLDRKEDEEYIMLFSRVVPNHGNHSVAYGPDCAKLNVPQLEMAPDKSILGIFNNMAVELISDAARFLTRIEVANSYNNFMLENLFQQVRPWLKRNGNARRLVDFINVFDINIKSVEIPNKPSATFRDIRYVHPVKDRNGNLVKDTDFRASLESGGTMVLTVLGAKVLQALDEGRPLMVDEFDSGFHTEVTRTVIEMFRDPEINVHNAQLILTTHNVKLMDEHTLRKDQIWFIQKNADGQSEIFSLADFEGVDEYANFSQWYLARRFGAVPKPDMLKIRRLFGPHN